MNQCEQIKQSCYLNCNFESQACFQDAWREARIQYREYVREMEEAGEEIDKTPDDFYNPVFCDDESCPNRCDASHRSCYPMCGGQSRPTPTAPPSASRPGFSAAQGLGVAAALATRPWASG